MYSMKLNIVFTLLTFHIHFIGLVFFFFSYFAFFFFFFSSFISIHFDQFVFGSFVELNVSSVGQGNIKDDQYGFLSRELGNDDNLDKSKGNRFQKKIIVQNKRLDTIICVYNK